MIACLAIMAFTSGDSDGRRSIPGPRSGSNDLVDPRLASHLPYVIP
jgi:hypothetical protein